MVRGGDGAIQVVAVSRLDYIEAADDAILLATSGTKLRKQQPLSESQLDPDRFIRIHRAYVVNIERIEKIELYARQPRRDPPRWNAIAGQPKRVSAVEGTAVGQRHSDRRNVMSCAFWFAVRAV